MVFPRCILEFVAGLRLSWGSAFTLLPQAKQMGRSADTKRGKAVVARNGRAIKALSYRKDARGLGERRG